MAVMWAVILGALGIVAAPTSAILHGQEKGGDDYTGSYNPVVGWPKPSRLAKPGQILGSTSGIWAETPNKIFILYRGEIILPPTVNGRRVPANFTGGMSWNMRSHFHRSDGFEAFSQF